MRIAICDDELCFIEQLRKGIESYSAQRNMDITIQAFTGVDDLLLDIEHFDVVFLDIRFNGQNIGIEWAKKLRAAGNNTLFIMYSSLTCEMHHSFEAEPIRFLTKPVKQEALDEALDTCTRKIANNSKQIIIKSDFTDTPILLSRIVYVESFERHRKVALNNGTQITTIESLKSICEKLSPVLFGYSHKSFIVQFFMVNHIEQNVIHLMTGDKVPLSRKYAKAFKDGMKNAIWRDECGK